MDNFELIVGIAFTAVAGFIGYAVNYVNRLHEKVNEIKSHQLYVLKILDTFMEDIKNKHK